MESTDAFEKRYAALAKSQSHAESFFILAG